MEVRAAAALSTGSIGTRSSIELRQERDRQFFARVAGHEGAALRALFDRYFHRAVFAARRVLRDRSEAEDVAQETVIELWQRSSQFDARRGSAATWVTTIARSRAIDRLRARARAHRLLERAASHLQPVAGPAPDELEDLRRNHDRLHQAIDALTTNQRAAVQLAYFDELSQAEIAARTGRPLGTVKLQRRTALEALSRFFRTSRRATILGRRSSAVRGDYLAP